MGGGRDDDDPFGAPAQRVEGGDDGEGGLPGAGGGDGEEVRVRARVEPIEGLLLPGAQPDDSFHGDRRSWHASPHRRIAAPTRWHGANLSGGAPIEVGNLSQISPLRIA